MNNPLYAVVPELRTRKGFFIYLDIDKPHFWFEGQTPKKALCRMTENREAYDAILLGGSTGVTIERIHQFSSALQSLGYPLERIGLLPPSHEVIPRDCSVSFAVLAHVLTSSRYYYREELVRKAKPQCGRYYSISLQREGTIVPVETAYLLVEPARGSTVAQVTDSRVIRKEDHELIQELVEEIRELGLLTLSLEGGSGSTRSIHPDIVHQFRHFYDGLITVGGGIKTSGQARELLDAGADLICVGDTLEKSVRENGKALEEKLLELSRAVRS
ncbi:hypothetical protein J4410_00750 [Candidatus Woesearchaeota archaeon]|nr:hypothetical protein [Candidatus Woesearchaeota archaeon]